MRDSRAARWRWRAARDAAAPPHRRKAVAPRPHLRRGEQLYADIAIPPSTRWTRRCATERDARRDARLAEAAARRVCRRMSRTRGPRAQAQALGRVAGQRESKEERRLQAVTLWSPFCSAGVGHPACLLACLPDEVWNRQHVTTCCGTCGTLPSRVLIYAGRKHDRQEAYSN